MHYNIIIRSECCENSEAPKKSKEIVSLNCQHCIISINILLSKNLDNLNIYGEKKSMYE